MVWASTHIRKLAFVDVLFNRVIPILGITFVYGIDLSSRWYFHISVSQYELPNCLLCRVYTNNVMLKQYKL